MTSTTRVRTASGGYAPPAIGALGHAIGRIVTGRPLPAPLRPAPVALGGPASVEEGIRRTLAAHCPR